MYSPFRERFDRHSLISWTSTTGYKTFPVAEMTIKVIEGHRLSRHSTASVIDDHELDDAAVARQPMIMMMIKWVTLSFRNTKVLHKSVTPNNRFNT